MSVGKWSFAGDGRNGAAQCRTLTRLLSVPNMALFLQFVGWIKIGMAPRTRFSSVDANLAIVAATVFRKHGFVFFQDVVHYEHVIAEHCEHAKGFWKWSGVHFARFLCFVHAFNVLLPVW